jgi:hypothetical protein
MSRRKNYPPPLKGRINCRVCGRLNIVGCLGCKRCKEHCCCEVCLACSARQGIALGAGKAFIKHTTSAHCKACGRCKRGKPCEKNEYGLKEDFCGCRGMPKWVGVVDPKATERLINTLHRPLGLEIELCSLVGFGSQLKDEWQRKPQFLQVGFEHDGSVRGAATEAVINPLVGDQFLKGIVWLGKYLNSVDAEVDDSCGLHVHVGAQDFGPYELRRLMQLYRMVERDIYERMIPAYRGKPSPVNGKYYAKPYDMGAGWWQGLWSVQTVSELREYIWQWVFRGCPTVPKQNKEGGVQYIGIPALRRGKYQIPSRYYGLNIHSWFTRGTVEWRHYPGTLRIGELVHWPLLCGWLTQLASEMRDSEVLNLRGGLAGVIQGKWAHGFSMFEVPLTVREWTLKELGKERE